MKMVLSRFGNLGVAVGLAGTLSQAFFLTPISNAQPLTLSGKICKEKGKYAVVAQHPILGASWPDGNPPPRNTLDDRANTEYAHEHIFFCEDRNIVDNIGFGPQGRFSYSSDEINSGIEVDNRGRKIGRVDDFALIDNNRYDSDIIKQILAGVTDILPNRCEFRRPNDRIYGGVINNCQGFTARVREEYKKRMLSGTWTRNLTPFQGNSRGCFVGSANGTAKEITLSENNYQITIPGKFAKIEDGYTSGAKGEVRGNTFNLTDAGGGFIITYAGKITDYGNTLTGQAICRYGSGSASATQDFIWKRKAIGPFLAEGL
jgi:hypothetical protein